MHQTILSISNWNTHSTIYLRNFPYKKNRKNIRQSGSLHLYLQSHIVLWGGRQYTAANAVASHYCSPTLHNLGTQILNNIWGHQVHRETFTILALRSLVVSRKECSLSSGEKWIRVVQWEIQRDHNTFSESWVSNLLINNHLRSRIYLGLFILQNSKT